MAKRRKRTEMMVQPPMPSPTDQRKWSAKNMARTMIETDPRTKRTEDAITKAVMAAGEKALKSARRAK